MIRVLQIVTCMNRCGLETMIMNHYRKLNRKEFQFDFLVHREEEGDYEKEILELGGKIYRISRLNPFSIKYFKELHEFFKVHRYKVVHCHLDCMSAFPLKIAKKYGVDIRIAHSHSKSQDKDFKYPIKLLVKHFIGRYATHLFACGEEAGKWMFGHHKYIIVKNAIDVEKFRYDESERQKIRKELKVEGYTVLGHVGRFFPAKNHIFLIKLFNEYSKDNQNAILWLIGDGEGKKDIEKVVKQMGLDEKVYFWGNRSDVNSLYQAMDVFIFPSLYEGLPLTMVEAQSASLPCVMSNNVPDECIMTNLIQKVGLEEGYPVWKYAISRAIKMKRYDMANIIKHHGFDVEKNIKILESIYKIQ